jgi:ABC-type Co2+ transport system permease subunit
MYVEVVAGMGVAGLLAFSWLTVRTLKAVGHAAGGGGLGLGVAAAFAAMAIHGLVDSFLSFTATYIAFAVVLGLAAGLLQDGWADAHRV